MPVETTTIEGLLVVRFDTHQDDRGFFRQTHQLRELEDALGRPVRIVQANHARSGRDVVRGFHAEPWDKLLYVARGVVLAAVADIRPESTTFGQVVTFRLGDPPLGERLRLFVAEGLANAYGVIEGPADYLYDVSEEWRPGIDKLAIAWDDPDLAVAWPIERPVLSDEDRRNPTLRERFPEYAR